MSTFPDDLHSPLALDHKPVMLDQFPKRADLFVFVVNENEWQAAVHMLRPILFTQTETFSFYYASVASKQSNGKKLEVILSQSTDQGSSSVQQLVHTALRTFGVRLVVAAGCAFGFASKKLNLKLLDVLVSDHVLSYEHVREGSIRENRNIAQPMNTNICNLIKPTLAKWNFIAGTQPLSIHQGVLLCGDKLIDDKDVMADIVKLLGIDKNGKLNGRKVVGGEMEGSGMVASAQHHNQTACLVVKGISDWGHDKDVGVDESEPSTDTKAFNQRCATYAALDFVVHALSMLQATEELYNLPSSQSHAATLYIMDGEDALSSEKHPAVQEVIAAHNALQQATSLCDEQNAKLREEHKQKLNEHKPALQREIREAEEKLYALREALQPPTSPVFIELNKSLRTTLEAKKRKLLTNWPSTYYGTLRVDGEWLLKRKVSAGTASWTMAKSDQVKNIINDQAKFIKVQSVVKPSSIKVSIERVEASSSSSSSPPPLSLSAAHSSEVVPLESDEPTQPASKKPRFK